MAFCARDSLYRVDASRRRRCRRPRSARPRPLTLSRSRFVALLLHGRLRFVSDVAVQAPDLGLVCAYRGTSSIHGNHVLLVEHVGRDDLAVRADLARGVVVLRCALWVVLGRLRVVVGLVPRREGLDLRMFSESGSAATYLNSSHRGELRRVSVRVVEGDVRLRRLQPLAPAIHGAQVVAIRIA